jgi:hypothetical protein
VTGNPQTDLILDKRGRRTTEVIKARTTQALGMENSKDSVNQGVDRVEDLSIAECDFSQVKGGAARRFDANKSEALTEEIEIIAEKIERS